MSAPSEPRGILKIAPDVFRVIAGQGTRFRVLGSFSTRPDAQQFSALPLLFEALDPTALHGIASLLNACGEDDSATELRRIAEKQAAALSAAGFES
jgi:hypothetical protein